MAAVLPLTTIAAHAATLKGDSGKDEIEGTNKADKIYGYAGNDFLVGGDGADLIKGGKGNDFLDSGFDKRGEKADLLYGEAGSDAFSVGPRDKAWGGPGNDSWNVGGLGPKAEIFCGPGRDLVYYLDKRSRPITHACETVKYYPAG